MSDASVIFKTPKFTLGQVVRHKFASFRGVVFDVDAEFNNTEEWWNAIPEKYRPEKDQPFYRLLAENSEESYEAYVSQQNLLLDTDGQAVHHPSIATLFDGFKDGRYTFSRKLIN